MKNAALLIFLLSTFFVAPAQIITTIGGCGIGDDSLATAAELFYPHNVAVDSAGNIFIAEAAGNRVRKVVQGIIKTIAGNGQDGYSGDGGPAINAEFSYPSGIATDKYGNVFIADQGNNCIRKIDLAGRITTFAGNGTPGYSGDGGPASAALFDQPIGLNFDVRGNLYVADADNNRIRKIDTSGIITTVAGTGAIGYSGDGGAATAARLSAPFDVSVDHKGAIYIADFGNSKVRKVDTLGIITTVAGNGLYGFSGDGGPATDAEMRNVTGVAVDTMGDLYFSDSHNFRLRKVDSSGIITTIAGKGIAGFGGDDGPADSAKFCSPAGVTLDKSGNIYISDTWNNRVRELSPDGMITTFAGQNGLFADDRAAIHAEISLPDNIAVDAGGKVYIADYYNNRIRAIDGSGNIATVAGNGISGVFASYSGDGGNADSAQMLYPSSVAIDSAGNIYISDTYNSRIRKVSVATGIITTIAGNGTPGYSGDGGAATAAEIDLPEGLAVDKAGNVYLADGDNYRIRKINASGIISTIAGNGIAGYGADGGLADTSSIFPIDVATDEIGNIYIADATNRIRKVDTAGIITTVAGNGTAGFSGDGTAATMAELNGPGGVKVDRMGNIYISDYLNNRIRMVDSDGIISTIAGNGIAGLSGDGGSPLLASLNGPTGVAIDMAGNVYVADGNNYRVRKISNPLAIHTVRAGLPGINVYPNPVSDLVNISSPNMIRTVVVSDISGQTIVAGSYNDFQVQVNTGNLLPGIYFIKVNGATVKQITKE